MSSLQDTKNQKTDKILTVQIHHENLDPRTFKVPIRWIHRFSLLAWLLIVITLTSVIFAVKTYRMKTGNSSTLIQEMGREITLFKKNGPSVPIDRQEDPQQDPKSSDTKPAPENGIMMEPVEGVWSGLAPQISIPDPAKPPAIELNDVKLRWEGKFAILSGIVAFREPGKGSQQGHLVVLARGTDRIFAHPETVLNVPTRSHLFEPDHGEYFSVSRFRILKTRLGPFESPSQLQQIQIYLFDLDRKLILLRNFQYGKK